MTPERLAEIKARSEAATPGPWRHGEADGTGKVAEPFHGGSITAGATCCIVFGHTIHGAPFGVLEEVDAEFIAHARADVPALVAEIERLRGALLDIAEYWNGDHNEMAMGNACEFSRDHALSVLDGSNPTQGGAR